jgi:hypothetical protein
LGGTVNSSGGLKAKLTTYRTALYALLVVITGIGLLLLSNIAWFDSRPGIEATANQFGGILITTGGLGLLWELRGKRDIMEEMLERLGSPPMSAQRA